MWALPRDSKIHHGDALGVDQTADALARELAEHRFRVTRYPVTASEWRKHGKRAGVLRNERMLRESSPDLVLAFWDGLSPGTHSLIRLAATVCPCEITYYPGGELPWLWVEIAGREFGFWVLEGRIVGGDPYALGELREAYRKDRELCFARAAWRWFEARGARCSRRDPPHL